MFSWTLPVLFWQVQLDSLVFGNGVEFSATNPAAPPLLSLNLAPGLQYGVNQAPATITNRGSLAAGKDLTLAADNLDLQGQLKAGGDLTLKALDTVKVRDTAAAPFIAASAGQLLVQGNQAVDIFALDHPDSALVSGGDIILRSANRVNGDAHYWSGGNFSVEKLDGNLGDLASLDDPVIRSLGDVRFDSYEGASLHIFAAGRVKIPGDITITEADSVNGIKERVTLSDGTSVRINGKRQLTLDVRAGMNPDAIGNPPVSGGNLGTFNDGSGSEISPENTIKNSVNNADILIGNIQADIVYLTNKYVPNPALTGKIVVNSIMPSNATNLSSVIIDSSGKISLNDAIDISADEGNGGKVKLLSDNNITTKEVNSSSDAFENGNGGKISLSAIGNIRTGEINSSSNAFENGNGGRISLSAIGNIRTGEINSSSDASENGVGGKISLSTIGNIRTDEINSSFDSLEIMEMEEKFLFLLLEILELVKLTPLLMHLKMETEEK